jgi:putative ABC transport system ATP-binding protein
MVPVPHRNISAGHSRSAANNTPEDISNVTASVLRRLRRGTPVAHLSAWENVAVPKLLDGVRLGKVKPDAVRLLDRVGLGNRTEHRPSEVSGGQMQRVAVARAMMMDPPLILADEPTGNLDSATGASILALLAEVAHEEGRGRLVVMVTHNSDAAAATDRVITLQDGRLGSDERSVVSG